MTTNPSNSQELILGIDLGTDFSVYGVYRNGQPEIIPNDYGLPLTPSVVLFADEMTCVAGSVARGYSLRFRDSIISEMKRVIGLKYDEVSDTVKKYFPLGLEKDENGKTKILVDLTNRFQNELKPGGLDLKGKNIKGDINDIKTALQRGNSNIEQNKTLKGFYPEYICAQLLKNIKECAENYCNQLINKAIITVPADFSNEQRECTKKAGEAAGLNVIQLFNEPTAAALAYIYYYKDYFNTEKKLLVFDIGGGTCDITTLKTVNFRGQIIIKILSTKGDQNLGGRDFDNLIIEKYLNYNNFNKDELKKNENYMLHHRLKLLSEKAKKILTSKDKVTLHLEKFMNQNFKDLELTRKEFEDLCNELFEKCRKLINESIKEADLKSEEIEDIILVGGSSRIPKIKLILQEIFNKSKIHDEIDPDTIVAVGATILAGKKSNKQLNKEFRIEDVVSKSLGIEVYPKNKFKILIPKNSTIPFEETEQFKTAKDNQKTILIKIYEGEEKTVDKNRKLGEFKLMNLPEKPKGEVKIDVFFKINENGILEVSANEKGKEENYNTIKIINLKENSFNNQIKLIQKSINNEPSLTETLIFYNKKISNAKKEEKFDLYYELINKIHSIFNQDYLNNLKKETIKIDHFIVKHIQFLFFQYTLMFSYKKLNNDDEIIKDIKIHIFKYLKFIIDNIDISLLNLYEFIEDFTTNEYLNIFSILFISIQYFELSLKLIKEYDSKEKEEVNELEYKHVLIRKADFFLTEASYRLQLENVIESISNVSDEITNFYNNLKNEIEIYKIKCEIKEQIALASKVLIFVTMAQIAVTEKVKGSLQFINNAYQIYLRNKTILHQNDNKYFNQKDYEDLLKIYNIKRIGNNLLRDFNEIKEEEFNLKEKELLNEIEKITPFIDSKIIDKKNKNYIIENKFLSCKKENNYYKFIEFILNNNNYENLSKEEIKNYLSEYSSKDKSKLIDKLKLIYSHQNYEPEDILYEVVSKIEGYLNNIKKIVKNRNN